MTETLCRSQTSPVKTMQLNDQKAGMQGLDKEAINKVIYEASKGTPYFAFQEKRQQRIDRRINGMLEELKKISELQKAEALKKMDALAAELESTRDISHSIVHIDMDAFYAAVEMLDNPELKTKPMAVGSSSMLSTSNYEARRYGVRAAMPGFIAKKLCPELIIVPPHFDKYKDMSKHIKNIVKEYDPNYAAASLDEVYFDLTDYILKFSQKLKHEKYCVAELLSQSPMSDLSEDDVMLEDKVSNPVGVNKCIRCAGSISDMERDTLAYEIVHEIRNKIFEKTQLTASAGIAPNTMLAKVCSDQNKPNGQYQIHSNVEEVKNFIATLPVKKVSGIGPVQSQLLNAIGINTCKDLWDKRDLVALLFTPLSVDFYIEVALGLGNTTVKRDYIRKSIGTEVTFKEIHKPAELHQKCEELCEELVDDLKSRSLVGKLVVLKIKTVNFDSHTRNLTIPLHTSDRDVIVKAAKKLLDGEINAYAPQPLKLRLMGIRMGNLLNERDVIDEKQAKLSDFLKPHVSNVSQATYSNLGSSASESNSTTDRISDSHYAEMELEECERTDVLVTPCATDETDERTAQNEVETENKLTCPVCGVVQKSNELSEFNSHVDNCLSKKAIREILSSEMAEISPTPDKRKLSSIKAKNKKMKSENGKVKRINDYFQ